MCEIARIIDTTRSISFTIEALAPHHYTESEYITIKNNSNYYLLVHIRPIDFSVTL